MGVTLGGSSAASRFIPMLGGSYEVRQILFRVERVQHRGCRSVGHLTRILNLL